ncbi:hypothetical protein R3P38DRAFT_2615722 [Favolaschia claudopus]|uniref:CxC5 like cysteine cluster associated with KDZ domain-containing protein n=1 Tax=Favolaschia claudopus TaxID=2862362 RepID=A0AAW0CJR5_9AGAR
MDFAQICKALDNCPLVASTFTHADVVKYIEIIALLKPTPALEYLTPSHLPSIPPETLPANVHEFMRACFDVPDETAKWAWEIFREIAWAFSPNPEEQAANRLKHVKLFLVHGIPLNIGVYSLSPPTRVCLDPDCCRVRHTRDQTDLIDRELVEATSHPISVFTLDLGAVPGFSTSTYCRNCHTRYYPNYYVHSKATTRTYYYQTQVPELVESSKHFYTSAKLCELFTNMMVSAWTSGTNCARIYNTSITQATLEPLLPHDWPNLKIDTEDVFNSFFLYALLLDHHERNDILQLRHDAPSHAERLRPALEARNSRMAGTGQEEWNHYCDLCCWIYEEDGVWYALRSAISDGDTMGHYSCNVQDCQNRLRSKRDKFCADPLHHAMQSQCSIVDCTAEAPTGFRTCNDPDHRAMELHHYQRGTAMFQLKERLQRAKGFAPSNAFPNPTMPATSRLSTSQDEITATGVNLLPDNSPQLNGGDDESDGEEVEYTCPSKSGQGNRKLCARFGRRRTHNEQLGVYSCGIVAGRATFFGSEAPNGVVEFWMKLFPTRASLPRVLWHDNNCSIVKMLRKDLDDTRRKFFEGVALPVDVFHFKCKHKEGDVDCGANCNPYGWPELRTSDGKWRFNSSAAEQTNAWFGGFHSVVREMTVERYNFFLDEMIKRRNRSLVDDLRRRGKNPGKIPREALLAEDAELV